MFQLISHLLLQKTISHSMHVSSFEAKSSASSSLANCPICYTPYNLHSHKPLIVCNNQHTLCKFCLLTIRANLRCPFCRNPIVLHSIRLNKTVIDYLEAISKRGSQISNPHSAAYRNPQERLITDQTNQQHQQPSRDIYLHESQFISQIQQVIQHHNTIENECSLFMLMLDLYFLVLQLATGVSNLYLGYNRISAQCVDVALHGSNLSLRVQLQSLGFFEVMFAVLFVYFIVLYMMGVANLYGLRSFQLTLVFFAQVKNFEAVLFYIKFLMNERGACRQAVTEGVVTLLVANCIELVTGFYFLAKLYFYILEQ